MQSIESDALEPTKADLKGLGAAARLIRLLPVYVIMIMMYRLMML